MAKRSTSRRVLRERVEEGVREVLEQLADLRKRYPRVHFDLPPAEADDDLVQQALENLQTRVKEDLLDSRYNTIALPLELPERYVEGGDEYMMIDVDPKLVLRAFSNQA